jgi:hypothetical protein
MRLTFTKGAGKSDWLDAHRADGTVVPRIECPKQRIIPHDMVHFAVESVLAARGFLTALADGGDAGFGAVADGAVERLVETMQAEAWSAPADTAELIALYELTCAARGDVPLPLDATTIDEIRAKMAQLAVRWDALPVGSTLGLDFIAPSA